MTNISSSRYISHVNLNGQPSPPQLSLKYVGENGVLFRSDCLDLLANIRTESVDLVFVDPPFNLRKDYADPNFLDDWLNEEQYRGWCKAWLIEAVRVLKQGGALFLYHWPKWLMDLGSWLQTVHSVEFRNWIALKMKSGFPIKGRLHPAHYGLLYCTKAGGKPTFNVVRSRTPVCKCGKLVRDYGGYRDKYKQYEDENGVPWVQISDFWEDTRPATFDKAREQPVNELPIHIPERAILIASNLGDVVLDFFAGAGSTIHAAERNQRHWIAADVGEPTAALRRIATFWGTKEAEEFHPAIKGCFPQKFREEVLVKRPKAPARPVLKAGKLQHVDADAPRYSRRSKVLLGIGNGNSEPPLTPQSSNKVRQAISQPVVAAGLRLVRRGPSGRSRR